MVATKKYVRCLAFWCLFFPNLKTISITLQTENNSTHQQAQQPFNLVVTVADGERNTGNVVLDGLQQLRIVGQQRSNNITMVNGAFSSNITYYFTVVATTPGTLTVGPAKVHHNGKEVVSNTLSLVIDPSTASQPAQSSKGIAGVKLVTNKNEVVVGEAFDVSLVFATNQQILDAGTGQFESPDFEIKAPKQWLQRQEVINGSQHHILEKKYSVTALKEGSFDLGPLLFEAVVPAQKKRGGRNGIFDDDLFSSLFGNQPERIRMQTNSLQVNVKPIPTKEPVDGVGLFNAYRASISATQAQTHEPLTLSLDLEGNGNFEQITIPKLNLPEGIKYYESKNETIDQSADGAAPGKKHFEFVLQATKAGNLSIPEQKFSFFDTAHRRVTTLSTDPISLTISKASGSNENSSISSTTTQPTEQPKSEQPQNQPSTPNTKHHPEALPWWIFVLLLITPMLFYAKTIWQACMRCFDFITRKNQASKAHQKKQFAALIKKQDLDGIYTFFITYIALQKNIATASVSTDDLEQYLAQRGFDFEKIDDFITFLGNCSRAKYGQKALHSNEQEALLNKAQYWFLMLV